MMVLGRRAFLGLTASALGLSACAQIPPPAGPTASTAPSPARSFSAPAWRVGDQWVYEWTSGQESGTKTVEVIDTRDVNGVAYYIARIGDVEHYYTRELHWAAAVRDGRVEARIVPPQPWFHWPLTVGDRWTHHGRFEERDRTVTHDDRFTVIGAEDVTVPAGRYHCVKLLRETDRRDGDEFWYAAEVGWHVRWIGRRGDTQFEERLREYRTGPPTR
jgi:hypothetical protein